MRRRFLALGLAAALVFGGSTNVYAAEWQEPELKEPEAAEFTDSEFTESENEPQTMVYTVGEDGKIVIEPENGNTKVYGASGEGLTPLPAPAWVRWNHSQKPGEVEFETVDGAEGMYQFELYRDGRKVWGTCWHGLFAGHADLSDEIDESGTYVVKVASAGDYMTSSDSSYTVSDEFVYTRPGKVLGTAQNLRWNEENPAIAEWDLVEGAAGYEVSLYLNGSWRCSLTHHNYSSYSSEDFSRDITESGDYTFTVRALSGNINEIANGTESSMSTPYPVEKVIAQVKDTLDQALAQAQTDANAALDAVKNLNKTNLQAAMQADTAARDKIKQLEAAYADQNHISTSNYVDASIGDKIDSGKIQVVGAALNAASANTNMTLNFRKPEKEAVIDSSQYKNAVQIDITLDGVADSQNLAVPMTMTVPIPKGVAASRFHIIHCHMDGTTELIHPIINEADRTATFTVTRFSTFVFANEADSNGFTDVSPNAYYAAPVNWAVERGITNGISATAFGPEVACTRGQIVTFLWRAAGSPEPASTVNPFTDIKSNAYYYKAVLWAVEKGITTGTSTTAFSPDVTCNRGQAVTFLYRYAGEPSMGNMANPFGDVKNGAYYYNPVLWAVSNEVTNGTSAAAFSPNQSCTRGQIVTFLYRAQN